MENKIEKKSAFYMQIEDSYDLLGRMCVVGTVTLGSAAMGDTVILRTPAGVEFPARLGQIQKGSALVSTLATGDQVSLFLLDLILDKIPSGSVLYQK